MGDRSDHSRDKRIEEERLTLGLDHLYSFAGTVGSNLDVSTLLEDALPALKMLGEADGVLVALVGDEGDEGVKMWQLGWEGSLPDAGVMPQVVAELSDEVVCCESAGQLPWPLGKALAEVDGPCAVVPLIAYGRKLGILVVCRGEPAFETTTLKLLNTAGRQLAMATENSRLFGDLQRSYRKLMGAQEELIRSERLAALGGLAATMAHEIRNPLATIFSSLSQIRKHGQIAGDSATLLEIAEEEALRLNRMVAGLLEFARPRTPRIEELRPADILREVVEATAADSEHPQGVSVTWRAEPEEAVTLLDPELFRRAVQHLVSNAIAAVDPGDGEVVIQLVVQDDPEEGFSVDVRDNGSGITEEVKHHVFEPFYSTKPSGIGLGLPVVKRIVEDQGGAVSLTSELGKGTSVQLLFKPKARGLGGLKDEGWNR